MKIATWNINSLRVRLPHVQRWLEQTNVDVLAVQEIKMENSNFPQDAFTQLGYHCQVNGQKTYNGVAIISRFAIEAVEMALPNFLDEQRRVIAATINNIRIINLYVPNGEAVDSPKYHYKLAWLQALHDYLIDQLKQHEKVVVLGDINIAPEDQDVHDPERWRGQVLFSESERHMLQKIIQIGFKDSFRLFPQAPKLFSWWDYRAVAFRRNAGLRIDHIFLNEKLAVACQSCVIDKEPRRWEQPSDHAPVVAELIC
jgi:exodeoxyribonuclease-3